MKLNKTLMAVCAISALGVAASRPALADDGLFPTVTSVESNMIGVGVGFLPDYMGSDDYTAGVAPMFRYEFGNHRNVQLIGNYANANLIDSDNFHAGPALRYRFGRDDVDDAAVDALPEIDDTLEAGFNVEGSWVLDNNPRDRFAIGVDALWDTGDASEGFNATGYARVWQQVSEAVDIGLSGNLFYGDDNFNDAYFGITPAGATASGLPAFNADGGLTSFSIQPMVAVHLSEQWHLGAGVRYTQMTGDASDSPIVDDRGSEHQWIAGLGVVYSWGGRVNTK